MKNENNFSFLLVALFFFLFFFLISQPDKNFKLENIKYVKIAGQNIRVDLALTPMERSRGLSGRQSLNDDAGMLFVFDYLGYYPFWMKEMNFSIDIIWLVPFERGKYAKVVYIKKDARPEEYPATYCSDRTSQYVLEVLAGFADKNNLQIGDRVEFTY